MSEQQRAAADFAVEIDRRKSTNDAIVFDLLDTRYGGGGRFVATRQADGRLVIEVQELGETTEFRVWKDEPLPFERWEVSPGMTLEDWRSKTTEEIIELAGGVDAAWKNQDEDDHGVQNKMDEPWAGKLPPLGTIGYDAVSNDFAVLLRLDSRQCKPAEPEDGIKRHPTYGQYLKWARFGLQPPPMAAWDTIDLWKGRLAKTRTGGRRRTLAAQEAGRRGLVCWYSPTADTGGAKWHLEKGNEAIERLLRVRLDRWRNQPMEATQ